MSVVELSKPLGDYVEVFLGRSSNEEIRRGRLGSGGAVTSLLIYLLEEGVVDSVVVARRVKGLVGELVVARTREEVLKAAGSKWNVLPFTSKLKETIEDVGVRSVAIVGLPCQSQFLQQMRSFPLLETDFVSKIRLIISLFCIGTFATEAFISILEKHYGLRPESISQVGVERSFIKVVYDEEEKLIPINEVLPYLQLGCLVCPDYTGVFSDISAGVSEGHLGYTVLIVRNDNALSTVHDAVSKGYLEVVKAPPDVIEELEVKARGKIVRAAKYMGLIL